jgi:cytochrome o ubiquinol oxidase subunit 2
MNMLLTGKLVRRLRFMALLPLLALLGACQSSVLNPSGDVAMQQRDLLLDSVGLMLVIIIPVMVMIVWFAWRYRHSNAEAKYDPDWDHSTHLELAIWAAPLLIIVCLGALAWVGTHLLDPYREIGRISADKAIAAGTKPLNVEVVALDWKWLFIYPDYGIATVNEMAAPLDTPIDFKITASSVMNSFYVPALAGQIYAMPGMETKLHAVINTAGTYTGFSANYSGAGFSGMHFDFKGLSQADFISWVAGVKAAGGSLDNATYLQLERPSENEPVHRYAAVGPNLYDAILNMCVEPGKMCESQMAMIDAQGGLGLAGVRNTIPVAENRLAPNAKTVGPQRTYVASLCTASDPKGLGMAGEAPPSLPAPANILPLKGLGLLPPTLAALHVAHGPVAPANS